MHREVELNAEKLSKSKAIKQNVENGKSIWNTNSGSNFRERKVRAEENDYPTERVQMKNSKDRVMKWSSVSVRKKKINHVK